MMYKNYKLSHFFLLALLFVIGLVSFAVYGWRTNAPSNLAQDGLDVSTPFYNTQPADDHNATHEGQGTHDTHEESAAPAPHGH